MQKILYGKPMNEVKEMTKLEEKLIELGYEHRYDPTAQKVEYFKSMRVSNRWIRLVVVIDIDRIIRNCVANCIDIKSQQDIDNLQQAFNVLQKDLEVLKECLA